MPRPSYRVRLENGLKLDINSLARRGFIRPSSFTGPVGIKWTSSYFGEGAAAGIITAGMSSDNRRTYQGRAGSALREVARQARVSDRSPAA